MRGIRRTLVVGADRDELLRLRERKRLEQDGVDDTEDRGVRADADRQREHGDNREAR